MRRYAQAWPTAVLALIASIAIIAGTWWGPGRMGDPKPAPPAGAAEGDLATTDPFCAYDTAIALVRSGADLASLPWFRRALTGAPGQYWEAHHDYAAALFNATFRVRRRHGLEVPETRSAWERGACMRTALEELAVADSLCSEPADQAALRERRAGMMHVWGFRWEALIDLRLARLADPSNRAVALAGDQYLALLHHPGPATATPVSRPGPRTNPAFRRHPR